MGSLGTFSWVWVVEHGDGVHLLLFIFIVIILLLSSSFLQFVFLLLSPGCLMICESELKMDIYSMPSCTTYLSRPIKVITSRMNRSLLPDLFTDTYQPFHGDTKGHGDLESPRVKWIYSCSGRSECSQ